MKFYEKLLGKETFDHLYGEHKASISSNDLTSLLRRFENLSGRRKNSIIAFLIGVLGDKKLHLLVKELDRQEKCAEKFDQ